MNGFGTKGTDLDINLNYDDCDENLSRLIPEQSIDGGDASASQGKVVSLVAALLKEIVAGCHHVKLVPISSRFQLLKFQHDKLKCDLSFCNRLAVRNTEYQRFLATSCELLRPLVYTVRAWATHCELRGEWIV